MAAFIPPASPSFLFLYLQQIRTFLCFDCIRPCHSLSNNKSEHCATHTHASLHGAKAASLLVLPFMFIFDFIMISKQTSGGGMRELGTLTGVTWQQIEKRQNSYLISLALLFVNAFSMKSNGNYFIAFWTTQMHESHWRRCWWLLWYFTIIMETVLWRGLFAFYCNNCMRRFISFHLLKCQPNWCFCKAKAIPSYWLGRWKEFEVDFQMICQLLLLTQSMSFRVNVMPMNEWHTSAKKLFNTQLKDIFFVSGHK